MEKLPQDPYEGHPEPSLKSIFLVFLKMGALAFGGVYSMLAFFERELVDRRGWLSRDCFAEGVAIGQMTPGPPIINTGIFIGYRLRGPLGAFAATAGQVLPGFVLVLVLGYFYLEFRDAPVLGPVLKGISAAVVGLLASVVYRLSRQFLKGWVAIIFAASSFGLLLFLGTNPIAIIALFGLAGYLVYGRGGG